MKNFLLLTFAACCLSTFSLPADAARQDGLDPRPIDSAVDPDIDLFINDWRKAKSRKLYGSLLVQDILTPLEGGDPLRPKKKGAVLVGITAISRATLAPGAKASGRAVSGERQVFYTASGEGKLVVNGTAYPVRKGTGFTLTPEFDFSIAAIGSEALIFYVRTEPLPTNYQPRADVVVVQRFDNDRRIGNHWVHIGNGGPSGMSLITIAPRTIPHPHSHPAEECWLMVEGETVLMLGKHLRRMRAGEAYKIPPTGITPHSNLNVGDEPVQMIFMGPAATGRSPQAEAVDYAMLDNTPFNRTVEPDIDMFIGDWRDSFPRIMHGNMYFRDLLTAAQGGDALRPTRKGAVLTHAEAVSYVMLEPGSSAHAVKDELYGLQQTFVVQSGTGTIVVGNERHDLRKGMAFLLTPGLDFKLTATGDRYMSFYAISEKIAAGAKPSESLRIVDGRNVDPITRSWVNSERTLFIRDDGLAQYRSVNMVELRSMAMSRPYSAGKDTEEIWIATDGDIDVLLGKQLRRLPMGSAYRAPPNGISAHSNINLSDKTASLLYVVN